MGPLGRILEELSRGGGAKGINIDQVCPPALPPPWSLKHAASPSSNPLQCHILAGSEPSLATPSCSADVPHCSRCCSSMTHPVA